MTDARNHRRAFDEISRRTNGAIEDLVWARSDLVASKIEKATTFAAGRATDQATAPPYHAVFGLRYQDFDMFGPGSSQPNDRPLTDPRRWNIQ